MFSCFEFTSGHSANYLKTMFKESDSKDIKEEKEIKNLMKQIQKLSSKGKAKIIYELTAKYGKIFEQEKQQKNELPKKDKDHQIGKESPKKSNMFSIHSNNQLRPLVDKKEQKKTDPEGLPNIGNICFMNSSLQLLYGADNFRNFVKKFYLSRSNISNDQNKFIKVIGELFYKMEFKHFRNDSEKQKFLQQIVLDIEKKNLDYLRKYQAQQDVLQIVASIINAIDSSLPETQQTKNFFTFTTLNKCSCYEEELQMQSMLYKDDFEYCAICQSQITKSMLLYPDYLLILSKEDKEELSIGAYVYEFVSKIMYDKYGTSSGHYICVRKEGNIYFEFNDNNVKEIKKDHFQYSPYYKIRLLLYKKKGSIKKVNPSCIW